MTVLDEIRAERRKQVAKGYDAKHDDEHGDGSMATQAGALAANDHGFARDIWGLARDHQHRRREQLVIAAALLVAEIERLDRAARHRVVVLTREQIAPRGVKRHRRAWPYVYHVDGALTPAFNKEKDAREHAKKLHPGCRIVLAWRQSS